MDDAGAPDRLSSRLQPLLERSLAYNPSSNSDLITRAFEFGRHAHRKQERADGTLYFHHPVAVAEILVDLRLDDASIVTALLHDVVEDTGYTRRDIAETFGDEIASLVSGVTKLSDFEKVEASLETREAAQAENFRKLIVAVAQDARVLLVKLADRLHNMRTLRNLKPEKQLRIARETMEVYAPLAGRMGMQEFREEFEDLAVRALAPGARIMVLRRFVKLKEQHGDLVMHEIIASLKAQLEGGGVEAEVVGRQKRPYSIWRKMQQKGTGFESLSDIAGFRIITNSIDACYRALGLIHGRWRAVPGRFKDYISTPRANGYASIHTTVIGPRGWRVEVQIRTSEMHDAAERGVAAHWAYRDGRQTKNRYAVGAELWLKDVLHRLEEGAPPTEFLENVKLEMFHDQVFCFSPKGDVKGLPNGATVLDFAYAVHTDLGNRAVGARIDGHRAPLWKEIRNGQTVKILTSTGASPAPEWEEYVKTGRAKSAIRRALRDRDTAQRARLGEQLTARAFARAGFEMTPEDLQRAKLTLDYDTVPAMLAAVGLNTTSADEVVAAADLQRAALPQVSVSEDSAVFLRHSTETPAIRFCSTCGPIPFERIVGIAEGNGRATVHRIDCEELEATEDDAERWLDLYWNQNAGDAAEHRAQLRVRLNNEPGALGKMCSIIGDLDANIEDMTFVERRPDHHIIIPVLRVKGARHLHRIMRALDEALCVDMVERISGDAAASEAKKRGAQDGS